MTQAKAQDKRSGRRGCAGDWRTWPTPAPLTLPGSEHIQWYSAMGKGDNKLQTFAAKMGLVKEMQLLRDVEQKDEESQVAEREIAVGYNEKIDLNCFEHNLTLNIAPFLTKSLD